MAVVSPTTSIVHGTPAIGNVNVEFPPSFSFVYFFSIDQHVIVIGTAPDYGCICLSVRHFYFCFQNLRKLCRFRLPVLHLRCILRLPATCPVPRWQSAFPWHAAPVLFSAVEPQPDKTDTHIQRDTIITVNFLFFILFLFDRMISPIHPICFPVTSDTCTSFSNTMYRNCRRLADNSHFIFSVHLIH